MADFGQFADPRTWKDFEKSYKDCKDFYGNSPRIITASCGAIASLDMDGCGYRCHDCFTIIGSVGCPCQNI